MTTSTTRPAEVQPPLPITSAAGFDSMFMSCRTRVYRYAYSRVGADAAEDVTADTFVQAWRLRGRFEERIDTGVDAWLMGIATNVIARHRKAERRWLRMCADSATSEISTRDDDDDVARRIDARRDAASLLRAVNALPNRERDPLLLHCIGGLSYEEVAAALDIPIGTVRSRISRARTRLASSRGMTHGD